MVKQEKDIITMKIVSHKTKNVLVPNKLVVCPIAKSSVRSKIISNGRRELAFNSYMRITMIAGASTPYV